MNEHSKDYHDYVFRDGKLVAEFEAMYRYSEGVPWHQNEQEDWVDIRLTHEMLKDIGPFDEIHDLGCGLGYYLDQMRRLVGSPDCRGIGYDMADTACAKARSRFPHMSFKTLDLTAPDAVEIHTALSSAQRLFIIRGTLWYVFPRMARVVQTIAQMMAPGDRLLVVQNFPPLESSFIGKDVIPNHAALTAHFASHFTPVRQIWYEDTLKNANDNWFIGLFFPRNVK
jgi:SAM-dependent methyltransferase